MKLHKSSQAKESSTYVMTSTSSPKTRAPPSSASTPVPQSGAASRRCDDGVGGLHWHKNTIIYALNLVHGLHIRKVHLESRLYLLILFS